MKKKFVIGLIFICTLSISTNLLQFYNTKQYRTNEKIYTQKFRESFNSLVNGFELYDGSGGLTNETAIKNSVSIVAGLESSKKLSEYSENKSLTDMVFYLNMFFTLESDEYINKNIDQIKPQLISISKDLDNKSQIEGFNLVLKQIAVHK